MQTYIEYYGTADNDPYGGNYGEVMNLHEEGIAPATIHEQILRSADVTSSAYVMLTRHNGSVSTLLAHRVTRYPSTFGKPPTPWDNQAYAFFTDVVEGQITSLNFPTTCLHSTRPVNVPTTGAIAAQIAAADEDSDLLGPYQDGAANTEALRTRYAMFVPPRYVPLLLGQRLRPKEAWAQVGGAIIADNKSEECSLLLDWLRVALTIPGGQQAVLPIVTRDIEIPPIGDRDFMRTRWELVMRDLPHYRNQAMAPPAVENGYGLLVNELREERRFTHERYEAERAIRAQPKTPTTRWPGTIQTINLLCEVPTAAHLPPVYSQLAAGHKTKDRQIIQNAFNARIAEADSASTLAPVVTADMAKKITDFGAVDSEDLTSGLQPFNVIYHSRERLNTSLQTAQIYDTIASGATAVPLTDLLTIKEADKIVLPARWNQTRITLELYSVVLDVVLGVEHRLVAAFRQFIKSARQYEFILDQACFDHPLYPALILRWVQLKMVRWFSKTVHGVRLPIPDFQQLLNAISEQEWYPPNLPAKYYAGNQATPQKVETLTTKPLPKTNPSFSPPTTPIRSTSARAGGAGG
ncbi:MAG: hypothetical protein ACREBR_01070 [bacterium]